MEAPVTVLFFGPPGAGKSSQFELLSSWLRKDGGLPVLPFAWARVRDEFTDTADTLVKSRLKELHDSGKLLPLFFSTSIWGSALMKELSGLEHLLIDGIPRHETEARMFHSLLEFYERDPVHVLYLALPNEQVIERLQNRRRKDDTEEGIRERLNWYETETLPLLNFLKHSSRYRVHDIDASGSPEEVHARIVSVVGLKK